MDRSKPGAPNRMSNRCNKLNGSIMTNELARGSQLVVSLSYALVQSSINIIFEQS